MPLHFSLEIARKLQRGFETLISCSRSTKPSCCRCCILRRNSELSAERGCPAAPGPPTNVENIPHGDVDHDTEFVLKIKGPESFGNKG